MTIKVLINGYILQVKRNRNAAALINVTDQLSDGYSINYI